MENNNNSVLEHVERKAQSWEGVPEMIPDLGFTVLEIARDMGLSVQDVWEQSHGLIKVGEAEFVLRKGEPANIREKDLIRRSVICADIKGVNDPGQRLDEHRLERLRGISKRERTQIVLQPFEESMSLSRREQVKHRLAKRWEARSTGNGNESQPWIAELEERRKIIFETLFNNQTPKPFHDICITDQEIIFSENEVMQLDRITQLGELFKIGSLRLLNHICSDNTSVNPQLRQLLGINDTDAINGSLYNANLPFMRMDLVQDENGRFVIVEFEPGKTHGWGFVTATRDIAVNPIGQGIAATLASMSTSEPLQIALSDDEQFYLDETRFLCQRVNQIGGDISCAIGDECDGHTKQIKNIADDILSHILSNKALMGIIHNLGNITELEDLLQECFRESLVELRTVIPETAILSMLKHEQRDSIVKSIQRGNNFFFKMLDTSGSRGIIEPSQKKAQIQALSQRRTNFIVQKAVKSKRFDLKAISIRKGSVEDRTGLSARFSVFSTGGILTDVGFTASDGEIAHGGERSVFASCNFLHEV